MAKHQPWHTPGLHSVSFKPWFSESPQGKFCKGVHVGTARLTHTLPAEVRSKPGHYAVGLSPQDPTYRDTPIRATVFNAWDRHTAQRPPTGLGSLVQIQPPLQTAAFEPNGPKVQGGLRTVLWAPPLSSVWQPVLAVTSKTDNTDACLFLTECTLWQIWLQSLIKCKHGKMPNYYVTL